MPGPVLALDLGGTQIRAATVLPDGSRIGRSARRTIIDHGAEVLIEACAQTLRDALAATPEDVRRSIVAIGMSSPGPIDPWRGVVVNAPNLGPDFRNAPLAAELERRLGLPAYLERDTNVAALAEQAFGAARGCPDFLYLTVSTGFGGSIMTRGELMLGPDGAAGELGHVQIELDGPRCGCGGIGHVEAICSGHALAREARAAAEAGRSPFLAERARDVGVAGLGAREVAAGEDAHDPTCADLMTRARAVFAAACVGYVNALNPTLIVVGGSIAEHQGDRLFQPARDAIAIGTFPVQAARVKIVPAALGPDVSLVGAQPLVQLRHGDPAWRADRPEPVVAVRA